MKEKTILIIGDDPRTTAIIQEDLKESYKVNTASSLEEAVKSIQAEPPGVAIVDYDLKELNGIEVFKRIRRVSPQIKVIMISGSGSISAAVSSSKLGIYDFLSKPIQIDGLRESIEKAMAEEEEVLVISPGSVEDSEWLQGIGERLQKLFKELDKVVRSDRDVLLIGEKGINKRPLAEIIHKHGLKRKRKFVSLDLLSFQGETGESHFWTTVAELLQERLGTPEEDLCGTLYLEGFETLVLHFQTGILEFLKRRKGEGGLPAEALAKAGKIDREIKIAIAITDEEKLIELDTKELLTPFLRLRVPPLRERKEDLPLLIGSYIRKFASQYNKAIGNLSMEALNLLMTYDWPGNVEELKGLIESAVLSASGPSLTLKDLPVDLKMLTHESLKKIFMGDTLALDEAKVGFERDLLKIVLEKAAWDEERVSYFLDIPKTVLSARLQQLGIRK